MATQVVEGFRLSPQQARLWQLQQVSKGACYKAHGLVRIEGDLDSLALENAFNALISRQEILRTGFTYLPGLALPVQVVSGSGSVMIKKYDLQGHDSEEQRRRVERLYLDGIHRESDYAGASILDVSLIALSDLQHAMILSLSAMHADGDSLVSLIRELSQEYGAGGRYGANGMGPIQYADAAEVFNTLLESEESRSGREYWRKKSARSIPDFKIGLESERGGADGFSPEVIRRAISEDRARLLEDAARRSGTSLPGLLLTCWAALIWRLSGRDDITIGTLYDGRTFEGLDAAIGLFARYLPVEFHLARGLTFADALRQVEIVTRDSYDRQNYFMWEAAQAPIADHACPTFYSVCFDYHRRDGAYTRGVISLCIEKLFSCIDRFGIRLSCTRTEDALSTEFYYDRALFQEGDVCRLAEQYRALVESVTKDMRADVAALEVLGAEERRLILHEFQGRNEDYGTGAIHQRIEEQAERTPDAIALVYEGQHVSHATLNRRANPLAHHLIKNGIGPESLVGISLERSPTIAIGLLAILKAGAGYLPLDPEYPAERLAFMLRDAGAEALLTEGRLRELFPDYNGEVIPAECWCEISAGESDANPTVGVMPENLAYVIYTSGSTGRPKGAMVTHAGVYNCISAMQDIYQLDGSDRFLFKTSLNFDSSVWEYFWPLWVGGSAVITRSRDHLDTRYLVDVIVGQQVTSIYFVPSMLGVFLKERSTSDCDTLRRVICGGESLTAETMQSFFASLSADFHHSYGPTETSIAASEWTCVHGWERPQAPIGMPLTNTQVLLLDPHGSLVPIKISGEVSIAGQCLGRGYLNRPDITAERFTPHAFSVEPGARLYRSGDLGRFLPGGEIEFLGRVDYQVKLRGQRIELGEIEAVLRELGAREAVVVMREAETDDKLLTAYITSGHATPTSAAEMTVHLKQRLPEYMVPTEVVVLDKMPLTSSGKVDRKALQEPPKTALLAPDDDFRSPAQEIIAGVFADILKRERVRVGDDFFKLGGHSLLATQVVSRIRDLLDVEMALRVLFESPTVERLAEVVEAARRTGHPAHAPIRPVGREGDLPLSYAQQRLWFIDQLEPGSPTYNIPFAVRLSGELDERALHKSLNEIVQRHEVLRTSFPSKNGQPRQHIQGHSELRPDIIDLTDSEAAEREEQLQEALREEANRGFDLSNGPLMRAKLIRIAEQERVLMINMHHIVSDGWSIGVMLSDLAHLYEACMQGTESRLPELDVQYADYAVWQRQWLQGEVLQNQLEYWTEQLEGVAVLELPTDRPRPAVASYRGASQSIELSEELTEKIRQVSKREGVTLFMTLLAGWQVFLARYSGQHDFAVGTPIAGRNWQETEGLIGLFLNTLVMRVNLRGNPTVSQLLATTREAALGAYAHQDVPFEKLVDELQPERSLSHHPLFQVWFVLQNTSAVRVDLADLSMKMSPIEGGLTKFDLMLAMNELPRGIVGSLRYRTDLFDGKRIKAMVSHLQRLLEGMAKDRQSRVMELPLMSDEERQEILVAWNQTEAEYPRDRCAHELFERQVEIRPDSVAVVYEGQELTYDQLNRRANQLAHHLQRLGVGPEVKVALCVERSLEMVVGLIGVMKAGGAYLPLDVNYPAERLAYMIEDAAPRVVLTKQQWKHREQFCAGLLLCLDQEWELIHQESDHKAISDVRAENLAYVIYTSGSTGRPKGVMLRHRSLTNYLVWAAGHYAIDTGSGAPVHSSLSFDLTITSLLTPFVVGGYVELLSSEDEVESLAAAMRARNEYGLVKLTPAHLRLLPELLKGMELDGAAQALVIGGENLPVEVLRWWQQKAAKTKVFNEYGPTETVVGCCIYEVSKQLEAEAGRENVPIGQAIANTRVYVLDKRQETVPKGVLGELYIGGEGLGRGYLNQADVTAERFVPSANSGEIGWRLYRTGDRARYEDDGKIEFLGRVDHQLKIRGYRIEPGEVEAAMSQHGSIEQALVVAREDEPGEKRLVGYVVVKQEVGSQELREYLRERLPDYMVPAVIVGLEQIPLTANGKVDRRALPRPEVSASRGGYAAARTAIEAILCGIWEEALGVERVGVEDNFFELGGDSILSIHVIARARQAGLQLTPRQFFERQTVAGLAGLVGQGSGGEEAITRVARDGELPLSYGQQRLWFIDQMEPGSAAYNIPAAVRLVGELDEQALRESLHEIVRRHEVLRTSFPSSDGQPRLHIHEHSDLRPAVINLTNRGRAERDQNLQEVLREEASRGFDLSSGPLIRAKLIKTADDQHVLIVVMHHIVSDGWSVDVMVKEFAHLYESHSQGHEPNLPDLEIQYADYAAWQREWLQGEVLETQLEYWKKQLDGVAVLELPTDRARPAVASYRGASERIQLSEELTQKLKQLSQREGVTLFMTLLAGLQVLLARYSGQEDIAVGTPISGRNRTETQGLIGFFLNTVVIRVNVGGNPSVNQLLARVREAALKAYAHQDVPFEKLVDEIRPERSLSYQPLFQVWFVMQNTSPVEVDLPGIRVEKLPIESSFTKFDLMLSLGEDQKELTGSLRYSTDLFDRRTIKRMLSHYEYILEGMTADEEFQKTQVTLIPI